MSGRVYSCMSGIMISFIMFIFHFIVTDNLFSVVLLLDTWVVSAV